MFVVPTKIDPRVRQRRAQQMLQHLPEYLTATAAVEVVVEGSGVGAASVRRWYLQSLVDGG
jgi:hypothetical protein